VTAPADEASCDEIRRLGDLSRLYVPLR
jgi:hypothetical protein